MFYITDTKIKREVTNMDYAIMIIKVIMIVFGGMLATSGYIRIMHSLDDFELIGSVKFVVGILLIMLTRLL